MHTQWIKSLAVVALFMSFQTQAQTPSANPRGYFFEISGSDVNSGNLTGVLGDRFNSDLAGPISCVGDQGAEDEFTLGCNVTAKVNPDMNNLTPGAPSNGAVQWFGGVTLSGPAIEGGPLFLICKSVISKGGGVVLPIICE